MILNIVDNVLVDPDLYVEQAHSVGFIDVTDGVNTFKNIQPIYEDNEFSRFVLNLFDNKYDVAWNFIRKSPINQIEPNFIHTDEMMGDVTVILYLSKIHPIGDGTTIYNEDDTPMCIINSKYNRMISFDSSLPHSRNIFENFGEGNEARLIQVIFLKLKDDI